MELCGVVWSCVELCGVVWGVKTNAAVACAAAHAGADGASDRQRRLTASALSRYTRVHLCLRLRGRGT